MRVLGIPGLSWWTRSQRIRTAAQLSLEFTVLETDILPAYQRIAQKAVVLQRLGLSLSRIATALGVTDKTIAKAITWMRAVADR